MSTHISRILVSLAMLLTAIHASADRGGFYYESIKYEAYVHKNNVWDVKETFVLNYLEPRHGFYRFIPMSFTLYHNVSTTPSMPQNEEFRYVIGIDDISVAGGPIYEEKEEYNNYTVQIGDPGEEVSGLHTYEISYTYTYPDDRRPDKDYLFHTILGSDFREDINHFEFRIEFEKPLPQSALDSMKWYGGSYGNTSSVISIEYSQSPTLITGSCDSVQPYHAITVFAPLPEGYYVGVEKPDYTGHYIWLTLTCLCLIFIFVRTFMLNRGNSVVKTIEFYPPDDISSAEVGVIIDTTVDDVDVASLIPWFAEHGYIKIEETENKDIRLTRLKKLNGNAPEYQKELMRILFCKGKSVLMKDIGHKESEMNAMKASLGNTFTETGRKALVTNDPFMFVYGLLLFFGTLTMATNIVRLFTWDEVFLMGIMWFLPAATGLWLRLKKSGGDLFSSTYMRVLYFVGKFVVMLFVAMIYVSTYKEYGTPMNDGEVMGFYVANFLAIELCGRFKINTKYRIDMAGKLLGFKEFIETAEKPYLEKLQMEDAHYFYRVLPYAMVFGLANKWCNKFKQITVEQPDWYATSGVYTGHQLTDHLVGSVSDTVKSHVSSISHTPSSSSGSSGGGFSGGGGGGGGGGSW